MFYPWTKGKKQQVRIILNLRIIMLLNTEKHYFENTDESRKLESKCCSFGTNIIFKYFQLWLKVW